jgi:hypothetical protein
LCQSEIQDGPQQSFWIFSCRSLTLIFSSETPQPIIKVKYLSVFSSPYQRQSELLPSLGVCRPLTFHILIFSFETAQPNEVKQQELPGVAMFVKGSELNQQSL